MTQNHKPHVLPLWIYYGVGTTLLILTAVTIAVAHFDFNALTGISNMNFIIAMVIATIKATLVALIFMHLLFDDKIYMLALGSGILCLIIFIVITMTDTQYRGKVNAIEGTPIIEQVTPDHFESHTTKEHDVSNQPHEKNK